MDKPFGNGGGRLERLVRHQVQHTHIPCVPDAAQNGQFELRTDGAERITVETTEVGCRTSATDDSNAVEERLLAYLFKGGEDGFLGSFALHGGGEELCLKSKTAVVQLMLEVFVTRCALGGDDGDALNERRQGQ